MWRGAASLRECCVPKGVACGLSSRNCFGMQRRAAGSIGDRACGAQPTSQRLARTSLFSVGANPCRAGLPLAGLLPSDLATALLFAVAKARGGPLRRTAGPGLHRPHSTLPSPCSRPSMSEHCRIAALSQQDSNLTSRGNMHAPSAADFQKASIRPTHQPLVLVIRPGSSPGEEVSRATAVFGAGCHRRQPRPGPVQLEKKCSTVEKSVCLGQQAGLSSSSAANACRCTEASSLMRRDSS